MKHAIIEIARRCLPLMKGPQQAEAQRLIASFERTANASPGDDELKAFSRRAAIAWEADMEPVCTEIVCALQGGMGESIQRLRNALPDLLSRVNTAPALASVLNRQLFRVFASTIGESDESPLRSANAETPSMRQWRGRTIQPTDLGSADLRGFSSELHLRSIWSARTTNADYLNDVADVVDRMLSGEINLATGRWTLMKKLRYLGYDPAKGFPDDMANVPPAEVGSLRDLSSEARLNLMLKTNVEITRNYGRVVEGNTEFARYAWPAWELVRLEWRKIPRGTPDSHSIGWQRRWTDAGESVNWEGAIKGTMIARKDSPIWQALADGAGGYTDTLGHPFPPFAFNSGMDWRAVPRSEWEDLTSNTQHPTPNIQSETGPMKAQLAPTDNEIQQACDRLGPDFRDELLKELEAA